MCGRDKFTTFCTVLSGSRAISGTPESSMSENKLRNRLAELEERKEKKEEDEFILTHNMISFSARNQLYNK